MATAKLIIGLFFFSAGVILAIGPTLLVEKTARYNHQQRDHQKLKCSQCHAISSAQIEVRELPGHLTCLSCHDFAAETTTAGNAFCSVCHSERVVTKVRPALFQFPKPGVESEFGDNFSHPSHLKRQPGPVECVQDRANLAGRQCAGCHQLTPGEPEMRTATGHAACFQCHCEEPKKRPEIPDMFDCQACHKLSWPRASSSFGKVREFEHADHEFDTRPRKKRDGPRSRTPEVLCSECHQSAVNAVKLTEIKLPDEKKCASCHTGRPGLPALLSGRVLDELKK